MKTVEFLFPEFTNIFGESYNMEYLGRCCPALDIRRTRHQAEPLFVSQPVDMVYMGCMPESKQETALSLLRPYRDRLAQLIADGTVFLFTGNAIELLGAGIEDDGRFIEGLGLFDFRSVRYMQRDRHNSQYIGHFKADDGDMIVLGHRSQFSFSYGAFTEPWLTIERGIGMNPDVRVEGLHRNNLFATYSLGPCFIMNPRFAKYILRLLGQPDTLAFERETLEACDYRLRELRNTISEAGKNG